jgi:hypothetical protein
VVHVKVILSHGNRSSLSLSLAAVGLLWLALSGAAFAKANPDYTQIGRDITIAPSQEVGDVTCIGCSIHVHGQVSGEATTVGGSIYIEDQGQVAGDVTAVAGSVRLEKEGKVAGDMTVVGGAVRRVPGSEVGGDVTSVGGAFWAPLILLAPFLFLALLVALVVWLVQRVGKPHVPAAAA